MGAPRGYTGKSKNVVILQQGHGAPRSHYLGDQRFTEGQVVSIDISLNEQSKKALKNLPGFPESCETCTVKKCKNVFTVIPSTQSEKSKPLIVSAKQHPEVHKCLNECFEFVGRGDFIQAFLQNIPEENRPSVYYVRPPHSKKPWEGPNLKKSEVLLQEALEKECENGGILADPETKVTFISASTFDPVTRAAVLKSRSLKNKLLSRAGFIGLAGANNGADRLLDSMKSSSLKKHFALPLMRINKQSRDLLAENRSYFNETRQCTQKIVNEDPYCSKVYSFTVSSTQDHVISPESVHDTYKVPGYTLELEARGKYSIETRNEGISSGTHRSAAGDSADLGVLCALAYIGKVAQSQQLQAQKSRVVDKASSDVTNKDPEKYDGLTEYKNNTEERGGAAESSQSAGDRARDLERQQGRNPSPTKTTFTRV